MEKAPNIWEFLEDNKNTLNEYIELRVEIFTLQFIRKSATVGGLVLWVLVLLGCSFLIFLFAALTLGFWLSSIYQNYIQGFAATTGIIVLITGLLFLARKRLFINPIIRIIIKDQTRENEQ